MLIGLRLIDLPEGGGQGYVSSGCNLVEEVVNRTQMYKYND